MTSGNGHNRGGIRDRLGSLERRLIPDTPVEQDPIRYEEDWRAQLETTATDLVLGLGPDLTFKEDAFYHPDGRLALSRSQMDIAALMGSGYEERMQELQVDAWERCLAEDEHAEEIVSELFELADRTKPPEDYWTWITAWPIGAEYLARGYHAGRTPPASQGIPQGCDGEPPMDPEDRERGRRLAWALIHDPGTRVKLEELCCLRNTYIHL